MRRKDGLVFRQVAGERLLVPVGERVLDLNGVLTLNQTAAYIWELLDGRHSVPEIVDAVAGEFAVEHEVADRDVGTFLRQLAELGLVDDDQHTI